MGGFLFLVCGNFIYNEIWEIKACGLNKNLSKYRGGEEGGEGEESGGQMNALIKAAALWLSNQDAKDKGGKSKGRQPAKRAAASGVAAASAAAAGAEPEEEESEDDGERKTRSSKKRRVPSRK